MKHILLLGSLLCCFITSSVYAQIAYQGFEPTAPANEWVVTSSIPPCTTGGDIWAPVNTLGSLIPSAGSTFWGVQDLAGPCGSFNGETLTFSSTSVAGFTNVNIQFDYDITGFDNGDDIFYTVILDGVRQTQVFLIEGGTGTPAGAGTGATSTNGYITETITIPNGTSTVGLEVLVDQNGGTDQGALDNFILDGTPPVSGCTHSITAITPSRGPVGTDVRITGAGFTNSSTVFFNGIAASDITFVSTTELIATAPSGVTSGDLTVTEAACDASITAFIVIASGATCGANFSNLVMSEVYDNNGGNLGYIELYNGTGTTIDLTLYRINRFANIGSTAFTHFYTFPASGTGSSIAPGQVLVGKVSADAGGAEDFTFTGSTSGFNGNDRLELVVIASGVIVDDLHDGIVGGNGFVYRRNTTISGPNPNFTASEWTNPTPGDVSGLGVYNIVVGGGVPVIATQPIDANTCEINLSVSATPSNGGALTYQWFFNPSDGATTGWSMATAGDFPATSFNGAVTDNLVITGNLTDYDNYQFYCRVTEGGTCRAVTEAVQFSLTTDRFFRSAATGDWTAAGTWEVATSAAGPWNPTCTYPTADNSDYIHIMATHEVTVNTNLLVDEVEIEFDGEVIIQNNNLLEFANATGVDLQINGILTDNGNGTGNGINFGNSGATWAYGTNGTVVKTGSSSVVQYRDNYEGGIANVPNTAIWRYRYTGNSNNVVVATVNMYYPNLYFESTNGTYSFSGASEVLGGTSGYVTIKGSFFIGTTGTAPVEVFNVNTNSILMQIMGNLVIGGNGFSGISVLRNHQGTRIATGMEVFGTLLINGDGQLNYNDGSAALDGRFRLHGNWTNNNFGNGFAEGQSTVEFVGGILQIVNKLATSENFHNIVVNKPNGFLQNNVSDMIIENDALFTRGVIRTSSFTYIVFEEDATATDASDISYVEGPVVKDTYTGTVTQFTYPTGNNNIYGPIGIETIVHTGESFIARYHNNGYGDYSYNANELDHVSRLEYWDLDEATGGSGENLFVTLHWGPHSDVITPNTLRVSHFYTQAPRTTDQWESEGNTAFTGTASRGSVRSVPVTSFSPFTLGDVIWQASLPLDLLRFDVTKEEQKANIVWEVANEHAGDRYCLQRSNDAQNFENIACFDATDNKSLAQYQYTDATPLFGYNYYRIHQVDYAGVSDYSPTKVVEFDRASKINIYPNPARTSLQLELPNDQEEYTIAIIDALGRTLINTTRSGLNSRQQLDVSKLAAGNYFLQVTTTTGIVDTQKITIVD